MLRVLKDYIYSLLGIIGALLAVYGIYREIWAELPGPDYKFTIYVVGFVAVWYFLESIYLKARWGRSSKYGPCVELISEGFAEIHKFERTDPTDISEGVRACERLCTCVGKAFTNITGTVCHVSVKVLSLDEHDQANPDVKILTFCRDSYPGRKIARSSNAGNFVKDNTDFLEVLNNFERRGARYFFSNKLPVLYGYRNSSFEHYKKLESHFWLMRIWRWPLPYRSTIVVPICPADDPDKGSLIGFLCVDSKSMFAFKKDYDVALLTGIAEGLYNVLFNLATLPDNVDEGSRVT